MPKLMERKGTAPNMTTEPNTGSFEDVANMITEPPKPEEKT